jgi:hypothetical protein
MKKTLCLSFLLSLFLISCNSILPERASCDFIQGNDFSIGHLYKNKDIYYLSFDCDLSKNNSAPLAITKSNVKIFQNEIHFYLTYALSKKANVDGIKLGKINPGIYQIFYIDIDKTKHYIQDIIIEL